MYQLIFLPCYHPKKTTLRAQVHNAMEGNSSNLSFSLGFRHALRAVVVWAVHVSKIYFRIGCFLTLLGFLKVIYNKTDLKITRGIAHVGDKISNSSSSLDST